VSAEVATWGWDRVKAVLLDALGTLVELPPPAPALVEELAARGVAVTEEQAAARSAPRSPSTAPSTTSRARSTAWPSLRERCTEVLRDALPAHARATPDLQEALLGALRFRPYPEVPDVLRAWRERGVAQVVASNWDVSLHEVLEVTGLAPLLDGVVTWPSSGRQAGPAAHPRGAGERGARAGDALHVGDSSSTTSAPPGRRGRRRAGRPAR
jgi:putative hydrolase of the HAD superfamily